MNRTPVLFLNVLLIATCGLVYELLAGTVASYVLGDSVRQFSLIIGIYLSAMGVGAWLSRYIDTALARTFVDVEIAVALLGGASAPLLFEHELKKYIALLRGHPSLGRAYPHPEVPGILRVLMPATKFHIYYAHKVDEDAIEVIAVWSAVRGRDPFAK